MEGDSHRYLSESSKICFTSWTRFLLKFLHGVLVIDIGTNFISTHPCILTEYSIFPGRVYTTAVCYFFLFNKFHIYATNIPVWLSKGLSTLDQIFVSLQIISQQIKVLLTSSFYVFSYFPPYLSLPHTFHPSGLRWSLCSRSVAVWQGRRCLFLQKLCTCHSAGSGEISVCLGCKYWNSVLSNCMYHFTATF